MMFNFGAASRQHLHECHPDLARVAEEAIRISPIDFAIIEGFRPRAEQEIAFARGNSKVKWPQSKHNLEPSLAFDAAPFPVIWPSNPDEDIRLYSKALGRFYMMAAAILIAAKNVNVGIRWGGDWDMDADLFDQSFDDLAHFELSGATPV